jgi:predicted dehydrogenase
MGLDGAMCYPLGTEPLYGQAQAGAGWTRLLGAGLGRGGPAAGTDGRDCRPCRPGLAARAALATRTSVPAERCFASLAEALDRVPCDAVLASLPTAVHAAIAHEAIEADKHVIVEKPFTSTLAEAAQLVRLAEKRGLVLMVSQNYRFYPAAIAAADLSPAVAWGAHSRPRSTSTAMPLPRAIATTASRSRCWPTWRSTT